MAERNAKLILMVGVLGVSASAILVRFSQAPSGVTAAYRLGWTVLLLLPVVLLRCRAELRRVTARDLVLCGASGVLLALHFLTWFESLKRTSVASSTVLVSTEVIFTALGFALFLHGKIPRLGVWAILLAFGGSALLALSGGGGAGELSGNLLALAAAAIVLSGSLVACQAEAQPQTWTAWVDAVNLEERTVTYTLLVDSMGEDMERTAPLAEDAQLLHTYEGEAYPLNPETLRYTQDMAQDGLVGTVELNGRGEVVRVQLNVSSQLDLTAAGLDFTGYCGEVYAAGGVGGINTVSWDEESCWVDPCNDLGQDSDHTVYMLPLAEGCTIQEGLRAYTTGLSSGSYPDIYRLTVVDGAVTAIEGVWPEAENTVTLPIDPEEETTSNPENMPEHDPDFYGENGAEDMPEYDPEFYGESGAQPLEPSGSGTA